MNTFFELEIVPGERIGVFQLGWSLDELLKNIDSGYTIETHLHTEGQYSIIRSDNFCFMLNEASGLYFIEASGNYRGKYKNLVGLGTTLLDLKGVLDYELDEEFLYDTMWWRFRPQGVQGIHFVPETDWDDKTPLTLIQIFTFTI